MLEEMTPLLRNILFSSFLVGGLGAFWVLAYSPLLDQRASVEGELHSLGLEHERLEKAQQYLPILNVEIGDLKEKLARARNELPNQREIPELLSSVSDRARDAGLEVNLFRPTEEVLRDFYAEVPVFFSVRGNYHQLAKFFDEVGKLDRIVTVSAVSIKDSSTGRSVQGVQPGATTSSDSKRRSEGKRLTEAGCTVTTFRLLDEEERTRSSAVRRNSTPGRVR